MNLFTNSVLILFQSRIVRDSLMDGLVGLTHRQDKRPMRPAPLLSLDSTSHVSTKNILVENMKDSSIINYVSTHVYLNS